jgi:hypothetical protein
LLIFLEVSNIEYCVSELSWSSQWKEMQVCVVQKTWTW